MTDLAETPFLEIYKGLYPDFPMENPHLNPAARDQFRIDAYEEFNRFRMGEFATVYQRLDFGKLD